MRAYPVATAVSNVRNNGPELLEELAAPGGGHALLTRRRQEPPGSDRARDPTDGRLARRPRRSTPRRATARITWHARRRGRACVLAARPRRRRRHRGPRPAGPGRRAARPRGHRRPGGAAVAGRREEGGARAEDPGRRLARPVARARRSPGCRWSPAGAAPGPGWPAVRRAELGRPAVLALAFPLHPPGRPEKSRADELLGAGRAHARRPGRPRPVRPARRSSRRASTRSSRCRTATTASRCRRGRDLDPGRRRWR